MKRARQLARRGRRLIVQVANQAGEHRVTAAAAAVAFFTFLAFIPTLAALTLIYGLVFDPTDVTAQLELLGRVAPGEVTALLSTEARRLTGSSQSALGLGVAGGLLVALWSASKGSRALIEAIDVIHDADIRHSLTGLYVMALLFTVLGIFGLVLVIGLLVTLPVLAPHLPGALGGVLVVLRWVVLFGLVFVAIGAFYRFAPHRPQTRRLLTPGALAATLMWLAVSYVFQLWVDQISKFSASFGSVSSVAVFLMWLYLSVLVVLIGAEIDRARRR